MTKKREYIFGGPATGWVVQLETGFTIYHSGDTNVFTDMGLIGKLYPLDLAMVAIGGHFTMDPEHAAYAVKNFFKESKIIPMHYGTFPPLKGTPEAFKKYLEGVSTEIIVMNPGETMSL